MVKDHSSLGLQQKVSHLQESFMFTQTVCVVDRCNLDMMLYTRQGRAFPDRPSMHPLNSLRNKAIAAAQTEVTKAEPFSFQPWQLNVCANAWPPISLCTTNCHIALLSYGTSSRPFALPHLPKTCLSSNNTMTAVPVQPLPCLRLWVFKLHSVSWLLLSSLCQQAHFRSHQKHQKHYW